MHRKIFLKTKYFFSKKIQNKFVNILELVLFNVLNTFEPLGIPKNPQKEPKRLFLIIFMINNFYYNFN